VDFTSPPVDVAPLVPVPPTDLTAKPPPPPRPQVPIVVPDDEELVDDVIEINPPIDPEDPERVDPGPPPVPDDPIEPPIFIIVEDDPKPIGGMEAILQRLEYPEIARKAGIEGRVTVEFVVEPDGSVSNAHVVKGIGGGCDEAAVKAITETPFTPGMQRRKPVRVRMWMPVVFRIAN
ncbi:MAG TPA: energy transducer TonB, partial [Rhodothermales bacterium]